MNMACANIATNGFVADGFARWLRARQTPSRTLSTGGQTPAPFAWILSWMRSGMDELRDPTVREKSSIKILW
jgi:hypothetical protein